MSTTRSVFVLALAVVFNTFVFAAAPAPPQNLTAAVDGNTVTFSWQPPATGDVPTSYVLEAALAPGGSSIASLPTNGSPLTVSDVPNGVYYVTVRAVNESGTGERSNEVVVSVPSSPSVGCTSAPNPPQNLTGTAVGNLVTLTWSAPSSGCPASSYAVHAGTATGQSDVTVANVGAATTLSSSAPDGTYYVRVVALNAFGSSGASNEAIVTVGSPSVTPPPTTAPPVGTTPPASPPPASTSTGSFAVSTTAVYGLSSISVVVNRATVGTLNRYFDPGTPTSCVPVPGARVVTTVLAGTVTYSAVSNTGVTWSGTATVTPGGCTEIKLTCPNQDCSPTPSPSVTAYHVWGGPNYAQYLGFFTCTFCEEYSSDSINNRYGRFGSEFSSTSIRNDFSQYGSTYSTYSACSSYASNPPRVYNANRTLYYGELTLNTYRLNAVAAWVNWLKTDVCE